MRNTMLKSLCLAAIAAVAIGLLSPSEAHARDWYVKASVGTTVDTQVEGLALDDGQVFGAAVGTAIGPVRVEAGVSHIDADLDTFGVSASALDYSATAYLDMPITDNTGVFIGAGVDYVTAEAAFGPWYNADLEGTGYHYTAGVATRLGDRLIGEIAYNHLEADLDGLDVSSDAVTAGVRFAL